jgi:hypothetical protein
MIQKLKAGVSCRCALLRRRLPRRDPGLFFGTTTAKVVSVLRKSI